MLEILKLPYTGCSGIGMAMALDKALSKRLVRDVGFNIPDFIVLPDSAVPPKKTLRFPTIVKPRFGGGSEGITPFSVVQTEKQLRRRAAYVQRTIRQPAICEEFIAGRELSVGIIGNGPEVLVLPVRETFFRCAGQPGAPTFCTDRVKSSASYRNRWQITYGRADLSAKVEAEILDLCRRAFLQLRLKGYARIDLRFTPREEVFFLEANPNPDLSPRVFGPMAEWAGLSYSALLARIVDLALQRQRANPIHL
jgi:D-alanine-D-alanine ligase